MFRFFTRKMSRSYSEPFKEDNQDAEPKNELEEGKFPIVLPLQLRRKQSSDSKIPQYTVISEKSNYGASGDITSLSEQRPLGFECNLCREQIATLLSLSTHVKFHRRRYCKYCYWILLENETMDEHIESAHRIDPGIITNV